MSRDGTDVTSSLVRRAEALLRSVVGITAAEVTATRSGAVQSVRVAVRGGLSNGQVVQNIRSALFAGLGVSVHATQIELVPVEESIASAPAVAPATAADGEASPPISAPSSASVAPKANGSGNGHGGAVPTNGHGAAHAGNGHGNGSSSPAASRGHGNGNGNGQGYAATEVAARIAGRAPIAPGAGGVQVERVELMRQAGRMRCRVVLAAGAERYSAIADAADEPMAEIPLAGRVACDALRAAQLTAAQFDGATITYLAGRTHVVAGLTHWLVGGRPEHLSGSAVVKESLEYAAAAAVVQALRDSIQHRGAASIL